ncbi:tetraspanin-33 [Chanos chanos]|uniref:Tetraspanin n=1 Tax=Chanos chanos TaxID=29144 RepID=A0A6J2W7Q2_CHACN|nr:tetraspanin-33-like [Chanos chanos]
MRTYRAIKYTIFVCCYIFWVASAVLIAVGTYAKVAKERDVVDTLTVDPALLLISVGSLMFMITFFGCFGALRNGIVLLKMFLGILLVILFLQITAAVIGFIFSKTVLQRTELLMLKAIMRYREDMDLENLIDFVQKKFRCCGVESYTDWSKNAYFNCSEDNPSLEACGVPFSCCIREAGESVFNTMCGYETQTMEEKTAEGSIHTVGCLGKIVGWAKQNVLLVGGLAVGLLCLEICMISLAAALLRQIKNTNQETNLTETVRMKRSP